MKNSILYSVIGASFVLLACEGVRVPNTQIPSDSKIVEKMEAARLQEGAHFFKGQVQVRLSSEQSLEAFVHSVASEQTIILSLLDKIPGRPIYLFEIKSSLDVRDAAQALKQNSFVEAASPNYEIRINDYNDPEFRYQWALNNIGQDAPQALAGKPGADISFMKARTSGSRKVVVAIVDTGIDYFHEDLAITKEVGGKLQVVGGNIWMNPHEIPANGKNDDNNGGELGGYVDDVFGYDFVGRRGDPMDDHGHGTHIAGVIGALRNNYTGIVGMNENVLMMGVRFLGARGGGSDWGAQQAIYYVIDMKRRFPDFNFIMNCSWGGAGRDVRNGDADDFLMDAFREAKKNNILAVVAAGNDALSNRFFEYYPANYSRSLDNIITVAASNNVDQLADFSNYGDGVVHVAAPGVLIHSTLPGNKYAAWSGTSMATPHVTGLASLVWAANPDMTYLEVKNRILDTVDVLPQLKGLVSTGGRINVSRALSGDLNIGIPERVVDEVALRLPSETSNGAQSLDYVISLREPDAREVSVCFSEINLSTDMDFIQIYGLDYRVRDIITGRWVNRDLSTDERIELCSASVPGDEVHIRLFSNGQTNGGEFGRRGFETESLRVVR